jgi:hypothetical protein
MRAIITPQQRRPSMMKLRAAVLVSAISALTIFPAMAVPVDKNPNANGNGWGPGGKPSVGAPGPIAGAGLAFLAAGGGYLVLRFRKRKTGPRKAE